MSTLEAFLTVAKLLPDLINKPDLAIWATDEEKFLLFDIYGNFNIKIKPGDLITPGGTPDVVLQTQQKISRYVPRDVYGVVCQTSAMPVEGGAIGISIGVENEEALQHALHDLDQAMEQIGASSTHIADDATTVSDVMSTIIQTVNKTNSELKEIDKIGELIDGIADQSRLISLNALIESARAGEHGRSFSVVAKEMQKLADETSKSILTVRNTLQSVHALFAQVNTLITEVEDKLRTQSASTQEIASALEEISTSIRDVGKLSKQL
ncbi:MAG: methyl-accepting chemotaxis protein [Tumebacillaceae bacterium]